MKTSVIIPTANNPTDLAVLLVQLQQQTVLPEKIYIADNSESGYATKIARRYQWSVPIYVQQNVGNIYRSWNKGLDFVDSDAIILNDDIMIPNSFIEIFSMASNTDQALVYCPIPNGFPPVKKVREKYNWLQLTDSQIPATDKERGKYLPMLTGWCFMLPKITQNLIGKFDEQFEIWYGDTDYDRRVREKGKIGFIDIFVQHFGTSSYGKIDKSKFYKTNARDQILYEKKHNLEHEDLGWDQYLSDEGSIVR